MDHVYYSVLTVGIYPLCEQHLYISAICSEWNMYIGLSYACTYKPDETCVAFLQGPNPVNYVVEVGMFYQYMVHMGNL